MQETYEASDMSGSFLVGGTNANGNGEKSGGSSSASDDQSSGENREKLESPNNDSNEIIVPNRTVLFMKRPEFREGDP
jgi:hypothetical protein